MENIPRIFSWFFSGGDSQKTPAQQILTCKNDFEIAVRASKELESTMAQDFGAPSVNENAESTDRKSGGTGSNYHCSLHDRITNARYEGEPLPMDLQRQLRYIATVRNQLTHDTGVNEISEKEKFLEVYKQIDERLKLMKGTKTST